MIFFLKLSIGVSLEKVTFFLGLIIFVLFLRIDFGAWEVIFDFCHFGVLFIGPIYFE